MEEAGCYENYPVWIVLVSNLLQIAVYVTGALIISMVGPVWLFLYLLYVLWMELRLLRGSCVNCAYYGKLCAFGKGRLSSLLFKKGDPEKFASTQITWKDMLPDLMVSLIPMIVGAVMLFVSFRWTLLALIALMFLLSSAGNALVRGLLACKYCKQRKLGCPAEKLFSKQGKAGA